MKAAVSRWKLEALTGLLGVKALQAHQAESQKNMQAENQRIRKDLWGYSEPQEDTEMNSQTILGDVTHPTPIIINGQNQQSGGALKTLAILAAGALIPGAGIGGYLASQWLNQKPVATELEDKSLDLGLLKFEDLQQPNESRASDR
jgi:hypothetical protein